MINISVTQRVVKWRFLQSRTETKNTTHKLFKTLNMKMKILIMIVIVIDIVKRSLSSEFSKSLHNVLNLSARNAELLKSIISKLKLCRYFLFHVAFLRRKGKGILSFFLLFISSNS